MHFANGVSGIILKTFLNWSVFVSAAFLVLSTGLYTALGGLRAVVFTEMYQTVALLFGGVLLMGFVLAEVRMYCS